MDKNTGQAEKQVQKLIQKTLVSGVALSATLLTAGLILVSISGFFSSTGRVLTDSGLLLLLMTPVARIAMLGYGYCRNGQPGFAVMAAAVLILLTAGFIIG